MLLAGHLPEERLSAEILTPEEEGHLAGCLQCRCDRRVAPPPRPAVDRRPPYVLGRYIDSGGMGVVYEARHALLGTHHAVKLLRVHDPLLCARMIREGRLQARVTHRHIVPVQEVIQLEGLPALVMPFVQGPTLAQLLTKGALPAEVALALFHAVVSGVAEIHRARLVHRDLKPGNILLEVLPGEVVPRVTDFGLAKALALSTSSLQTKTNVMMGTLQYAAPEQLQDAASAGPPADVFSLGAILYELLTGRRAFAGEGREPPALRVPGVLGAIVDQCLAPLPQRPPDAVALLASLPAPTVGLEALLPWCRALPSEAAPATIPPMRLPREPGPFFGREAELAWLDDALAGQRLVTVYGPGGLGKTRTALRYALTRGSRYRGGALWVDASASAGEEGLQAALGAALELPEGATDPVAELASRGQLLLLLDLAGPAEDLLPVLHRWLELAPALAVVVCSRQRLGRDLGLRLGGLGIAEAAALFVERGSGSGPALGPDEEELGQIAELAGALDGIPLAIELVAAQLRTLPLQEVLAQAMARLAGSSDPLQTVLDSTWEQLAPAARSALVQLSALPGPFSLEEAEQLVALDADSDIWMPDLAQELCERGLLQSLDGEGAVRLRLHASLRDHAARQAT
jgi:hypothetical protein